MNILKKIGLFLLASAAFSYVLFGQELYGKLPPPFAQIPYSVFLAVPFIILFFVTIFLFNRMKEKESREELFLSIVNHTFRTPLTRLKWMSDELSPDMPREERIAMQQNMSNTIDRIFEVVDILAGIQDITTSATYTPTAIKLREIIETALARSREAVSKKNIRMTVPTFEQVPLLTLDSKKLIFIIQTLIENAVEYTPTNGAIAIDCQFKKGTMLFAISDTGMGLSYKDKRNLFKRFYRNPKARNFNTEGMGLGLYLSKKIITRYGGKMWAESKGKNKGSIFYFLLPMK